MSDRVVSPGGTVTSTAIVETTGLVGTIEYAVIPAGGGAALIDWTAAGISESPPGTYEVTFTIPLGSQGRQIVYWRVSPAAVPFYDEVELVVNAPSSSSFAELQARVLANSFGAGRYATIVPRLLNDAVTEACRDLEVHRGHAILEYDATGVVSQPAFPFWKLESLWRVDTTAPVGIDALGEGEQFVARYATDELTPLPTRSPAGIGGAGPPGFFTARRNTLPSGRGPQLQITVLPTTVAGKVAVVGLRRPPLMAADTDVSGLGDDLDGAIVAWAKSECFALEDDIEMTQFWASKYQDAIMRANTDPHDVGPHITPGSEFDDELAFGGR